MAPSRFPKTVGTLKAEATPEKYVAAFGGRAGVLPSMVSPTKAMVTGLVAAVVVVTGCFAVVGAAAFFVEFPEPRMKAATTAIRRSPNPLTPMMRRRRR